MSYHFVCVTSSHKAPSLVCYEKNKAGQMHFVLISDYQQQSAYFIIDPQVISSEKILDFAKQG